MATNSDKLDTVDYSDFSDVVSVELADAMRKNLDFLRTVCGIGEIAPIMVNIPGVPAPNPNYWQECNGSEITNENSPLRSQGILQRFTPNMTDRYILITPAGGQIAGVPGGVNATYAFKHNHGGRTTWVNTNGDTDHSSSIQEANPHDHTIAFDLDFALNVEPPYKTVKFYMRIQ